MRSESYDQLVDASTQYRREGAPRGIYDMSKACNYLDLKPGPRGLLNTLILHLNNQACQIGTPAEQRFVVFPSNGYLALMLHTTERSIQRWAARLEEKGLLRRCYTVLNTRLGYDLAGFVSQIDQIIADFEGALASRRKAQADARQNELMLSNTQSALPQPRPNGIARVQLASAAGATNRSSRGDRNVTQNKQSEKILESTMSFAILDMVDTESLLDASGMLFRKDDRSGDRMAGAVLAITRLMTCQSGRLSSPWRQAVSALGEERAAVLWLCANLDPMRKGVPAQYFAWLVRALYDQSSVSAVTAAIGRAVDAAQKRKARETDLAAKAAEKAAQIAQKRPMSGEPAQSSDGAADWDTRSEDGSGPPQSNPVERDPPVIACSPAIESAPKKPVGPSGADQIGEAEGEDLLAKVKAAIPLNVARYHLGGASVELAEHGFTLWVPKKFSASYIAANFAGPLDRVARSMSGERGFALVRPI